jgi:hypothetical protein
MNRFSAWLQVNGMNSMGRLPLPHLCPEVSFLSTGKLARFSAELEKDS